ncbi:DNA-directed RNA polymerase subunit H [Candidatus Woesearchaeota archaeon]|nr:DNA-directed RNA polymerase subunit H [Candidatus Woesearchaeota archaeon]MBW3013936.1 DNA-directed RNA polymerase subunit H [Candidatus Woesearchaeota archaeon]
MAKEDYLEKHELIPKHAKIGDRAVKELLEKYNITKAQLPKILASDVVIKNMGLKVGDVLKIERNSPTAGKSVYYRVVADG